MIAASSLLGAVIGYFRMPDLTGASLEEIERKLADGRFKPADFARTGVLAVPALRSTGLPPLLSTG